MKFNAMIMTSALAATVLAVPVAKFEEIKSEQHFPVVSATIHLPESGLTFGSAPLSKPDHAKALETMPELQRRAIESLNLPGNVAENKQETTNFDEEEYEEEFEGEEKHANSVSATLLLARDEESTLPIKEFEESESNTFDDEKSRSEAGAPEEVSCLNKCEKNLCPANKLTGVACGHACNAYCK